MAKAGILSRAAALAALFLLLEAAPPSVAAECTEEQSCFAGEGPHSSRGTAMIQSGQPVSLLESRVATGSPPLRSMVDRVEKELQDLESRVDTLGSQVGNAEASGGSIIVASAPPPPPATPAPTEELAPAPEEAVLQQHKRSGHLAALMKKKAVQAAYESEGSSNEEGRAQKKTVRSKKAEEDDDDSWLYGESESLSLLAEGSESRGTGHSRKVRKVGDSLKDRVGEAERLSAAVKSKILALENAVSGSMAPVAAPDNVSGADLKHRLMALEDECDDLRTRTTTLEHQVMG